MFSEKTQMPHATLLETINQHFTNMKLTRWKGTPISDQTKSLINTLLTASKNSIKRLNKSIISLRINDLKILMKTISGKNCLHYHLYDIGKAHSKECTYCKPSETEKLYLGTFGEETATHILCECQFFSKLRQEIYGKTSLSVMQIISGNIKKNSWRHD